MVQAPVFYAKRSSHDPQPTKIGVIVNSGALTPFPFFSKFFDNKDWIIHSSDSASDAKRLGVYSPRPVEHLVMFKSSQKNYCSSY